MSELSKTQQNNFPKTLVTEGVYVDTHLNFPGCYKGTVLTPPCEARTDFDPVEKVDTYTALHKLKPSFNINIRGLQEFSDFCNEALLKLAKNDPSGEEVKKFEHTLIALYERFEALEDLFLSPRLTQGLQTIASRGTLKLSDYTKAFKLTGIAPESKAEVAVSGSPSLLDKAIAIATKVYTLRAVRYYADEEVSVSQGYKEEVSAVGLEMDREIKESALTQNQYQEAKIELSRQSKSMRVLNFADTMSALQQGTNEICKKIAVAQELFPVVYPKVLLACAKGNLWELERPRTPPEHRTPADDETLASHTFLVLTGEGIKFSMMYYDYHNGAISSQNSYTYSKAIHEAGWANPEKLFNCYELTNLVNLFPIADREELLSAVRAIEISEFDAYVKDSNAWRGSHSPDRKTWLDGNSKNYDQEFVDLLSDVSAILKGESHELQNHKHADNLSEIGRLLFNSYLRNSQGEGLLFAYIKEAVRLGQKLEEVGFENFGKEDAVSYFGNLCRCESVIAAPLLFMLDGEKLKLSQRGADYLIKLIDPEYSFHHTGNNEIDLEELYELKRKNPYHFNLAETIRRRDSYGADPSALSNI